MITTTVDSAAGARYSEHVNPQWIRLLDLQNALCLENWIDTSEAIVLWPAVLRSWRT